MYGTKIQLGLPMHFFALMFSTERGDNVFFHGSRGAYEEGIALKVIAVDWRNEAERARFNLDGANECREVGYF